MNLAYFLSLFRFRKLLNGSVLRRRLERGQKLKSKEKRRKRRDKRLLDLQQQQQRRRLIRQKRHTILVKKRQPRSRLSCLMKKRKWRFLL